MDPLVSVYLPTRNRSKLLARALDSALAQTYPEVEILVCDDASTDDTRARVADYAARYANVVYLRNDERQGACPTRNRAIFAARGRFLTGLDDDDEFFPDRVEQFVRHAAPRWSFLSTHAVHTTPSGRLHRAARPTRIVSYDDMLYGNRIGNQIFIESDRLREVGGFDPRYPAWQDYALFTRLIARYGPALRLGLHTQRIHTHEAGRISQSAAPERGRELYLEDFGADMRPRHHAVQRFLFKLNYPHLGEASYLDLAKLITSPLLRELTGAFLFQRHPEAMNRLSRLRAALRVQPAPALHQRTTSNP